MDDAPPSNAGACPDAERLVQFARGLLDGPASDVVREHARGCEDCGVILAAFTQTPITRPERGERVDAAADTAFAFGPVTTGSGASGVELGDLVGQKYRVKRLVGAGGMGVVVAATHVQIDRDVALKFMRPEACRSPEGVARFVREARAAAQIQSEHVARLLDVGTLDGGEPYMVMELLAGTDLAELLRSDGPLPLEDAVDYVLQASEAVAEAHRLGIVHRDLKPANLFLSRWPDGSPLIKVLDFGISKLSADTLDSGVGLTSSRVALGSPRYMSPEQLSDPRAVGPPADVWAFGCILYELLTGRPAFGGETMHAVGVAIATRPAPKARATHPELPRLVDDIIQDCLEKDATQRVQSVADLALRLAPLAPARSRVSVERVCRLTGRPPPVGAMLPMHPRAGSRTSRAALAARVLAAVGLGAVLVLFATANHRGAGAASSPVADAPVVAAKPPLVVAPPPATVPAPAPGPAAVAAGAPSDAPTHAPPTSTRFADDVARTPTPRANAHPLPVAQSAAARPAASTAPSGAASTPPGVVPAPASSDLPSARSILQDRK